MKRSCDSLRGCKFWAESLESGEIVTTVSLAGGARAARALQEKHCVYTSLHPAHGTHSCSSQPSRFMPLWAKPANLNLWSRYHDRQWLKKAVITDFVTYGEKKPQTKQEAKGWAVGEGRRGTWPAFPKPPSSRFVETPPEIQPLSTTLRTCKTGTHMLGYPDRSPRKRLTPAPRAAPPHLRHQSSSALAALLSTAAVTRHAPEWGGGTRPWQLWLGGEEEPPEERPVRPGPGADATASPSAPGAEPQTGGSAAHASLHGQPWGKWLWTFNLFLKPGLLLLDKPLAAMSFWGNRAFPPQASCRGGRPRVVSTGPPRTTSPQSHCGAGEQELGSTPPKIQDNPKWTVELSPIVVGGWAGESFSTQNVSEPHGSTENYWKNKRTLWTKPPSSQDNADIIF